AAPKEFRELALLVAQWHTHCHRALELKPATLLKVIHSTDALRRPERFEQFLMCCEADARGRTGFELRAYPPADYFRPCLFAAKRVNIAAVQALGLTGQAFGEALDKQRLEQLAALKNAIKNESNSPQ